MILANFLVSEIWKNIIFWLDSKFILLLTLFVVFVLPLHFFQCFWSSAKDLFFSSKADQFVSAGDSGVLSSSSVRYSFWWCGRMNDQILVWASIKKGINIKGWLGWRVGECDRRRGWSVVGFSWERLINFIVIDEIDEINLGDSFI